MDKITFHCEVVTPMFLAGADGITPELRAPSIKGALRFWWRAMNADKEDMSERETLIFGGTGANTRKSSFNIFIDGMPSVNDVKTFFGEEVNYSKGGRIDSDHEGKAYLFYSMFMVNQRHYYEDKSTFSLSFLYSKSEYQKEVLLAFAALTWFGGFGARTRRGAGSFWITDLNCQNKETEKWAKSLFLPEEIKTPTALKDHINRFLVLKDHDNNSFSILKEAEILIFNSHNDWMEALEEIGKPFQVFRGNNKSDITETPHFGFPVTHRNGTTMMAGKRDRNRTELIERRASPIIFQVIKTTKRHYFPVIIWLGGELIPSNYSIMDKKGGNSATSDWKIVEDFLYSKSLKPQIEFKL